MTIDHLHQKESLCAPSSPQMFPRLLLDWSQRIPTSSHRCSPDPASASNSFSQSIDTPKIAGPGPPRHSGKADKQMVVSMCTINHWQIHRKVQIQLLVFQQSLHRSGEQNVNLLILQERKKLQKTALSGNLQIINNIE